LDWHHKRERKEVLDGLIKLASELAIQNNAICWRVEPWALNIFCKELDRFQKSPVDMQPRHTALIPIFKDTDLLLAEFKPKVRYNIKIAQRHGLEAKIGTSLKDFSIFFETYKKTIDRKKLESKPWAYFQSIQKHFARDKKAFVINVFKDQLCIESILLMRCGDKITYFFGGFDYRYRNLMAPYLCHYEAIKLGQKYNCKFYDLWGIANTDDPNHPWQGFTEFKLKFAPLKITLAGARDIIFDKKRYENFFKSEIAS